MSKVLTDKLHDAEQRIGKLEEVLREFIGDIEATGGLLTEEEQDDVFILVPVADPAWVDLAETYMKACMELGIEPRIDRGA